MEGFTVSMRCRSPWLAPTIINRAVGQDWAVCLVYLPLSGDAAVPLRIDHSLRGSWQHPVDSRLSCTASTARALVADAKLTAIAGLGPQPDRAGDPPAGQ
jgi:hypothetical protein